MLIRRPEDTLCTAILFIHRYRRWNELQPDEAINVDEHVLVVGGLKLIDVACFFSIGLTGIQIDRTPSSNARNSTACISVVIPFPLTDRRIINPDKPPLTFPSDLYDSLRFSTVTSELIVLRILKFELRVTLPQSYLSRLIMRCLPPEEQPVEAELKQSTLYRWSHGKIMHA